MRTCATTKMILAWLSVGAEFPAMWEGRIAVTHGDILIAQASRACQHKINPLISPIKFVVIWFKACWVGQLTAWPLQSAAAKSVLPQTYAAYAPALAADITPDN
jgi:hypothetical protein